MNDVNAIVLQLLCLNRLWLFHFAQLTGLVKNRFRIKGWTCSMYGTNIPHHFMGFRLLRWTSFLRISSKIFIAYFHRASSLRLSIAYFHRVSSISIEAFRPTYIPSKIFIAAFYRELCVIESLPKIPFSDRQDLYKGSSCCWSDDILQESPCCRIGSPLNGWFLESF